MSEILENYKRVDATTWVYLSSLLTIALYFKFSRLWSIRNLDLIGLILLAPGMLLAESIDHSQYGYLWLFVAGFLFLIRLLLDPTMVRRPLLEPNLSAGGLTFLGASLFLFLMANVVTAPLAPDDLAGAEMAQQLQEGEEVEPERNSLTEHGPGYPLLFWLVQFPAQQIIVDADQDASVAKQQQQRQYVQRVTAKLVAILSHLLIILGMMLIGYRHFDNVKAGIATATLYLLLPYTAHLTSRVDHVLPAALLIWAVVVYRFPLLAGLLIGLATGFNYYPIFLLPLWISFYWQRGLLRFVAGLVIMITSLVGILAFTSADLAMFTDNVLRMFGVWLPVHDVSGLWSQDYSVYRLPVLAVFLVLSFSLAIWPAQKNLGTLISASAAVMLATQFWIAREGGLYMGWYLPLLLLTIFRPNLEDRVAMAVLSERWFRSRKPPA